MRQHCAKSIEVGKKPRSEDKVEEEEAPIGAKSSVTHLAIGQVRSRYEIGIAHL